MFHVVGKQLLHAINKCVACGFIHINGMVYSLRINQLH